MFRHLAIVSLVVLAALAVPAWAGDMEGKVQSVDTNERTVTLDNGTKVWLSESIDVDDVKAGDEVKLSYEEKDGKPVATSVEVK